jgi:hypothetical protein
MPGMLSAVLLLSTPSPRSPRAAKRALWRAWVLGFVVGCVLGLYALAATHHHDSVAEEEACAVCHVVGHQPLSPPVPPLAVLVAVLVLLFVLSRRPSLPCAIHRPYARYHSRAPPMGAIA